MRNMAAVTSNLLIAFLSLCIVPVLNPPLLHARYLPVGAKYIALGGMAPATSDDVYAIYYNPARMGSLRSMQVAAEFTGMFLGMEGAPGRKFAAAAVPLGGAGCVGAYWDNFSIDDLYDENTFAAGFGKANFPGLRGLSLGGTVKYHAYSLRAPVGAYDDNGAPTAGTDPLFAGGSSKAVLSFDAGLSYRINPHYTVGLAADDITEPNISLVGTPGVVLPRRISAGVCGYFGSYRFNLDLGTAENDYIAAAGVQKQFDIPLTLYASLRNTRRLYPGRTVDMAEPAVGLRYTSGAFSVTYAVNYPLNGLDTFGDHTVSLMYRFLKP